ncbi:MAG: T9SS type A sorting domain-containing protein [Bacteroidota bacterium]
MLKKLLLVTLLFSGYSNAQCDSVQVPGSWIVSTDDLLSGTYVVAGDFIVQPGVTIYVKSFANNGCGAFKVYANNIQMDGTINGDYSGFSGGTGGASASAITSTSGHSTALTACTGSSDAGDLAIEGGLAGLPGVGLGGGLAGMNGSGGSGSKQTCGNFGDGAGVVGGSGGAGGGAGGSYGGAGSNGANGGNASITVTVDDVTINTNVPTIGGNGGTGGASAGTYGTAAGFDISLGSGGAGAGGGGRATNVGTQGAKGGAGGGLVFLKATSNLSVTGNITVKGENGLNGGNGGNGDDSPSCCSDGCDGCDEKTYSTGAGAGSGAGGGSGGGIYLETSTNANITGQLFAGGGNGGNSGAKGSGVTCVYTNTFCTDNSVTTGDGTVGNKGGAGGGGRIKIFVPDCALATVTPINNYNAGTGNGSAGIGSYEYVCGYATLEENIFSNIQISPNPFNESIRIRLNDQLVDAGNQIDLKIMDAMGRVVYNESLNPQLEVVISLGDLKNGYYFVQLSTTQNSFTTKLIKQ